MGMTGSGEISNADIIVTQQLEAIRVRFAAIVRWVGKRWTAEARLLYIPEGDRLRLNGGRMSPT
jgi:hypothetical protein